MAIIRATGQGENFKGLQWLQLEAWIGECPDNVEHHPSNVNCMPTANKSSCREAVAKGSRRASGAFNHSKVFLELRSVFKIMSLKRATLGITSKQ